MGNSFTRLEYIQSTGTQYIVTDFFVPADGLYLWADVQFVEPNDFTAGNEIFFDPSNTPHSGVNFGGNPAQIYQLFNWWGNYDSTAGGNRFNISSTSEVINSRNIYEVNDLTVSYGPHRISIVGNDRGVDSELPFLLFGGYKNDTTEISPFGRWNMRIYEMKLGLRDGTIVRHLVPALDSNGRPCLHDLISGQAFYNSGTGEFLFQIRADLPKGYTKVEYLESTGTQWIDTGIVPDEFTGAYVVAEGQPGRGCVPNGRD